MRHILPEALKGTLDNMWDGALDGALDGRSDVSAQTLSQPPSRPAPQGLLGPPGRAVRAARYRDGGKRLLDLGLCLALAPLWAPLVALLWGLVRLDGGAGFYGHLRVGRDGGAFSCWKLRSMCPDAPARLLAHLRRDPAAAREWAQSYKLRHDPRITRIGRPLRRYRLDELPQFWNVLRGEMSLVGPRPVTRDELREYDGRRWAYLTFRPGLTGLWQISDQRQGGYEGRVRLDCAYLMRAGLRTDLGILLRTAGVVLRGSGV